MVAAIDMTGRRYGRLVGIEQVPRRDVKGAYWRFRCDCNREFTALGYNVRRGVTRSCGCGHQIASDRRLIDLTGQRFGRLVAVKRVPPPARNLEGVWWLFRCDCNTGVIRRSQTVRASRLQSCGCARYGKPIRTCHVVQS